MTLEERLRLARERYNEYGQDLDEVSKHAKERWVSYGRTHQPKSYEQIERSHR